MNDLAQPYSGPLVNAAEAESLDERSITDDAFAARLRVLEDEIVDRHARGDVREVSRARFEQAYRASPYLHRRVQFAEALQGLAPKREGGWRVPAWAMAAAVIALIVITGYLVRTNQQLRGAFAHVQRQLEERPVPSAAPPAPVTATFVLRPPRRGPEPDATIIPLKKDATQVAFRLEVESDAYPRFWAALKDVANGAIVWRSPDVAAELAGTNRIATIVIPADVLRAQRYAIELAGVGKTGESELVGVYAVRLTFE